jgi:hypothetical protein
MNRLTEIIREMDIVCRQAEVELQSGDNHFMVLANYKKVEVRLLKAKEVSWQLNESISFILQSPQNFSPAM